MKPVVFPLKTQMKRTEVGDLHQALSSLGFSIAGPEIKNQRFGASTRAAVRKFQLAHKLPGTGTVDEATATAINQALVDGGALDQEIADVPDPDLPDFPGGEVPAGRRVSGTVLHADGSPIRGMLVRAFHRRVGSEVPLGVEVATNDRGKYAITYPLPNGVSKIDLFVRAFDHQVIVAVSPIIIGASAHAVLDLSVTDPKFRGPSEYARVTEVLAPQVAGAMLDKLDADDVALLVRNTGIGRESVTAWIAARRLAERTTVEHESLYGLVRTENTAALPRLLRRSTTLLRRALTGAAESNLISHAAGQRADATISQLRRLAVELSTSHNTPGSLGKLLATCTRATPAQQAGFIARYADHEGPVQALWKALRQDPGFGDAVVADLQLSLQLGTLAANHPPLVQALRTSGVRHGAQTATLGTEGWRQLLQTEVNGKPVGTPPNIKGRTAAERRDNYIALLKERSARAFPTAHVAKTLKTLPAWQSSTAVRFLDMNPDFNLLTANIKSRLNAGGIVLQPGWNRAQLEAELATVQRVSRMAPRGKEETVVNALLSHGYGSALAISRQSRSTFRHKTAAAFGGEVMADTVHRNAQFQIARTAGAYGLMHPVVGGGFVGAVGIPSTDVESDPTWASLFGNVDYCSCEHCRSIYSPAAYLVDLLSWLDGHDLGRKTAFERLSELRPDIQRIELSCDNTNTVMPYLDLVTEILEVRVLNSDGSGNAAHVPKATTATSPELMANPEFLKPQAYDGHLAKAVFPDMLPFDLWGELGRVYFEHLGVRRSDLMEALRRQAVPRNEAVDAERLQFSMPQWHILTGAARHEVWEYWGYESATPDGTDYKIDLAVVSTFLRLANIDYEQLLDLLHSRFVGSGGIRITGADCNTDEMTIVPLSGTSGDETLGDMQRFLRLWRNRGWTMLDLDKTLHALNITTLDAEGLGRLADLDRVQTLTHAPLLDLLSWWASIDTFADRPEKDVPVKSLYDRVYLNRAVDATAEEPEFPLALNAARTALANTVNWDDVRSILQAALVIDAEELAVLLDETVDGLPNVERVVTGTTATLDGLSALYRHVSLARSLKLTVDELLGLLRLVGVDPFDVTTTDTIIAFVEAVEAIRASEFSLIELHYLLEHDSLAETSVGVTDEAIGQTLVEMREGLVRVKADYAVVADPIGDITAQYLAVLLSADAVAAVMTALRTEADASNHAELEAVLTDNLGSLFTFDAAALISHPVERRFNAMVASLAPYLQETQGNAVIIEKVAGFSSRELDSVQDLLALRLRMTVDGREVPGLAGLRNSPYIDTTAGEIVLADDPEAFAALRRIYKTALVLSQLDVEIDAQVWLFDVGVRNGLLNPLALPIVSQVVGPGTWNAWTRLVDLAALATDLPGGEPSLVELLQVLEDPAVAEDTFLTELATRTGWLLDDIKALTTAFAPAFPFDWRDGRVLRGLVDAFALIGRLGVSAAQADRWATAAVGATEAEELRLAAKSKHDEAHWPAIARALRDPVREKQRAALVAYLIAHEAKYEDEEDLYADLLIDVEMAPCMLTSRIKQAISSVQLFVQRAFLNLEEGIELTRDDRDQWEWMKNYRVWEAARKVFLYPENWIEPELRLDKSPLFEQLENTLLQGELDNVAAEKAYTAYLEGLLKIARMEVMGLYHHFEEDGDGTIDILHVVARTKSHPREYYYRQWIDGREWTPWEKLDTDIEGNHVILAVSNRRLYVFWPVVVQKAEGDESSTTNFFEMKLAWIERLHEQWGARTLSVDSLKGYGKWDGLDFFSRSESGISSAGEWLTCFRVADQVPLTIECRQAYKSMWDSDSPASSNLLGRFVLDPCSGIVNVDNNDKYGDAPVVAPVNNIVQRMRFFLTTGNDVLGAATPLTLMKGQLDASKRLIGEAEAVDVLGKVPAEGIGIANDNGDGWFDTGTFANYLYPHQYGEFASQHGVFLDDDKRTFHVMPELVAEFDRFSQSDTVEPSNVGTTVSESDVFEPPKEDPPFEPDIPWDKQQDPPIIANKSRARLVRTSDRRAAPSAVARTTVTTDAVSLAADLTTAGLQHSQTQLGEVTLISDTMTFPQTTKYRFSLFYHPYVCDFMAELRRSGVSGLLDPDPKGSAPRLVRQQKTNTDFFANTYLPTSSVLEPYPIQDIDFEIGGAYSMYNWEIFFHVPMLIATRLSQNQRFEEARRWFHFMFDPTNRSDETDPLRFWKIKPFYRDPDAPIEEFLALAASTEDSPEVEEARAQYDEQIAASVADPFDPHGIAELRTTAYQKTLVMKYLDNLIAWGDQLFRRDTIESVNEATQLYVLALELLGERPDSLSPRSVPVTTTYEQVRGDLAGSVLNNPLVQMENLIFQPGTIASPKSPITTAAYPWANLLFPLPPIGVPTTPSSPPGFYFCIPPNEKLLAYWDRVEDRLFKIRHCMNIEGVVRQLPLFEPPIDPGMLVRARAAGIDLSSALADLSAPLPHYRFAGMLQKTYVLNQTVRGLGSALLSALEKTDAESLSMLRANQEVAVLEAVRQVKKLAIEEARHSLTAAEHSLTVVEQRKNYYDGLIQAGWLPQEKEQVVLLFTAGAKQFAASTVALIGAGLAMVPRVTTGASGVAASPVATADPVDGAKLAKAQELGARALDFVGVAASIGSSVLGVTSGWQRRAQEWTQQHAVAEKEVKQITKQIEAAKVRVALAESDLNNHERQIENARSVREFMEQKFTNVELYQWMAGQLSSLYFQSYQLAYDLAKQTERAYRHELALPDATFIQFGYWDSLKKGLLAGERLQYDLERMDTAYLGNNVREYEITKHVSLALLDPVALLQLQTAGSCEFSVPEALFDVDYPGHYLRRIKSVSVSIPCVTGPYTTVPARLSLVSSRTRVDPNAADGYPMVVAEGSTDQRFQFHTGAVQSIVVSSGRDDAGLFAADHRDERYLPFEGTGAISDWNLTLTSAAPTFDWSTITDVVLHLRYTAREGGDLLRDAALKSLQSELEGIPLRRAFSAMHEFPTEWNAFLRPATEADEAVLKLDLSEKRFPYFSRGLEPMISKIEMVALVKSPSTWTDTDATVEGGQRTGDVTLASADNLYGGNPSGGVEYQQGVSPGEWTVRVNTTSLGPPSEWIDDLIVIVTYQVALPA